jgi:hypothetical protein
LFFMHLFLDSLLFFGRLASGSACANSSCRLGVAAGASIDMGLGGAYIEIGGGTVSGISGITGAAVIFAAVTGTVELLAVELLAVELLAVELLAVELLAVELLAVELMPVELLAVELLPVKLLPVELLPPVELLLPVELLPNT